MGTRRNIQGWPKGAGQWVRFLEREQAEMGEILATCQKTGIERKNYKLVRLLLPEVLDRAGAIIDATDRIKALTGRRIGRTPKWLEVTRLSQVLAREIVSHIDRTQQEMDSGRWKVVGFLVGEMNKNSGKIKGELDQIPRPKDSQEIKIPNYIREAFNDDLT